MYSEIEFPDASVDLNYVLREVPHGVPAIAHELVTTFGRATAEGFIRLMLASVAGSAIAVLGQERACELIATQLVAAEQA